MPVAVRRVDGSVGSVGSVAEFRRLTNKSKKKRVPPPRKAPGTEAKLTGRDIGSIDQPPSPHRLTGCVRHPVPAVDPRISEIRSENNAAKTGDRQ